MKIIAIVNCTATKTTAPPNNLRAAALARMSLPLLAREWRKRVQNAGELIQVANLYCGRGFNMAVNAASLYGADIHVLSAGLGMLDLHNSVPSYSLTLNSDSQDYILARTTDCGPVTAHDWWSALTGCDGVAAVTDLVGKNKSAVILLGLSSIYLSMISEELLSLPEHHLRRIRIVGPKRSDRLPLILQSLVMPYDDRLNGPDSGIRGTEFDFPQRALTSFIRLVHHDRYIDSETNHAKRVRLSLGQMRSPKRERRTRVTDASLLSHIRSIKKRVSSITAGLRTLRKERKVACEQRRFSRLWAQLET